MWQHLLGLWQGYYSGSRTNEVPQKPYCADVTNAMMHLTLVKTTIRLIRPPLPHIHGG